MPSPNRRGDGRSVKRDGTDGNLGTGTFTTIVRTQYYKVLLTCNYGPAILRHVSRKTHLRPSLPASPITSSPHHFALVHHRKNAILYFQELAHSSQFTIPPIPRVLLRLRTLCQKHRGVGLVSLAKFPILL